jgi:bifunctional UDP-N-acetylglucosamine pyrophosphorylase / glucosamine-1-phosphate N-acetyltransferase
MTSPLTSALILASEGQGGSRKSVALESLCGRPVISYLLDGLHELKVGRVVIVVPQGMASTYRSGLGLPGVGAEVDVVETAAGGSQLGAAISGLEVLGSSLLELEESQVLLLPDDRPLLQSATIGAFVDQQVECGSAAAMMTFDEDEVAGVGPSELAPALPLGSVVERGRDGSIKGLRRMPVVAPELEREAGIYCLRGDVFGPALRRARERAVLTGDGLWAAVSALAEAGHPVEAYRAPKSVELLSVATAVGRTQADFLLRRRINQAWQRLGVVMLDPLTTLIDATVQLGLDVKLYPNTILEGDTVIEDGVTIGPATRLVDCYVGADSSLERTSGNAASVGRNARVGPFVSLEPGGVIPDHMVTGSFYTASPDS